MALSGKEMETVQAPVQVKEEVSAQAVQQQQEIKEGNNMAINEYIIKSIPIGLEFREMTFQF